MLRKAKQINLKNKGNPMRGYEQYFHALNDGCQMAFFVASEPQKYTAHFIEHGGKIIKLNCHVEQCPYCNKGVEAHVGLYAVIVASGGELCYFDFTRAMLFHMFVKARKYCKSHNIKYTDFKTFVQDKIISISKSLDNGYTKYDVEYIPLTKQQVEEFKTFLSSNNPAVYTKYQFLLNGLEEISRAGTKEEDEGKYE